MTEEHGTWKHVILDGIELAAYHHFISSFLSSWMLNHQLLQKLKPIEMDELNHLIYVLTIDETLEKIHTIFELAGHNQIGTF